MITCKRYYDSSGRSPLSSTRRGGAYGGCFERPMALTMKKGEEMMARPKQNRASAPICVVRAAVTFQRPSHWCQHVQAAAEDSLSLFHRGSERSAGEGRTVE